MDQVGEWISTVGTLVATAIALFLLWQGQQDRRALREETRRNQASRVTCWCEWSPDTQEGKSGHRGVPAIFVRNMSEQSVYGVFVDYYHPEHGLERIDIGPVPPGETRHRSITGSTPTDPRWEPSALMPALFFSDAQGYAWKRTVKGRLIPDPGPHGDEFSEPGGKLNLGLLRPD